MIKENAIRKDEKAVPGDGEQQGMLGSRKGMEELQGREKYVRDTVRCCKEVR